MKKSSGLIKLIVVGILSLTLIAGCSNSTNQKLEGNNGNSTEINSENEGSEGEESNASHAEGGEGHSEEGGEGESGDPSSPILQLNEGWDGVVNGIRTDMKYDEANGRFYGVVENTTNNEIKGILIELNLKTGVKTVVELGPEPVENLQPGEIVEVELLVSEEPEAKGVSFDAWEIHPESENVGGEGSESGEEGSSTGALTLKKAETYDVTKNGGRLVLVYNKAKGAFEGTLENVGNQVLTRARVEIHLDNGTELGPTTPLALKVGETIKISLETTEKFDTWVTHAEFGSGEGSEGSEHGSSEEGGEGSEGNGEASENHNESGE